MAGSKEKRHGFHGFFSNLIRPNPWDPWRYQAESIICIHPLQEIDHGYKPWLWPVPQSGAYRGEHRGRYRYRGRSFHSQNPDRLILKADPDSDTDPDPEFFTIRSGISQQRLAGTAEPVRVARP
jgi:hypothetical protein